MPISGISEATEADNQGAPSARGDVMNPDALIAIHGEPPVVRPFPVIELGHGKVEIGDAIHNHSLPALWFSANGQGIGVVRDLNRYASDGETLAVVTFENVEGLDVLLEVVLRIRAQSFPTAEPFK
jgi:hypothetical protein